MKQVGSFVTDDEEQNYSEVVDMEEVIETYCGTYVDNLKERLRLTDEKLPQLMAISSLSYFWAKTKNRRMWIDE